MLLVIVEVVLEKERRSVWLALAATSIKAKNKSHVQIMFKKFNIHYVCVKTLHLIGFAICFSPLLMQNDES